MKSKLGGVGKFKAQVKGLTSCIGKITSTPVMEKLEAVGTDVHLLVLLGLWLLVCLFCVCVCVCEEVIS